MDLDLRVTTPGGRDIDYSSPSNDGGTLALDSNAMCIVDNKNTEVVIWPAGSEPVGEYVVSIGAFGACGQSKASYTGTAAACGRTYTYNGVITASEAQTGVSATEIGRFKIDCGLHRSSDTRGHSMVGGRLRRKLDETRFLL